MNTTDTTDTADITRPAAIDRAPVLLLRLEGLALLALAATAYGWLSGNAAGAPGWGLFFALFLVPDVAMLGYLRSPRVGAWAYNLAHTDSLPVLLLGLAIWQHATLATGVALIWLAHIGFDRFAGYGLKYATAFGHTHLGTVGRGHR